MPLVRFFSPQNEQEIPRGKTVLDAARLCGITIESPCNANGSCGKCHVLINGKSVPACQYVVYEDIEVVLADHTEDNKSLQIIAEGAGFSYEINPFITKRLGTNKTAVDGGGELLGYEDGDTTEAVYALALDIGTTTLVVGLIDVRSGKTIETESALNPQALYAQDVLGRIQFASNPDGLKTMHSVFIEALQTMIASLTQKTGVHRDRIYDVVYSGNTTMLHLACAVDPSSLGRFPYTPKLHGGEYQNADELALSPFARIYLPPIVSAYVGADIVSGILSSRLAEKKGVTLFIDIGTNGEMVLARNGSLAASSTAAGPAFEGMNISCGMRASRGAIESFAIDGDEMSYEVIGDSPTPTGICGSGLLDIAAELVRTGVIGKTGRFAKPAEIAGKCAQRLREVNGKTAFFMSDEVHLSQNDVRQIQLAKGAIRCGAEMLLERSGLCAADVDTVEIAGSFGYHLREKSLITIGLLPQECAGKVVFVGNTSMSGAAAFLLNKNFRSKMTRIVEGVSNVELANDKDFEQKFVECLGF
ncbi:MAG: ASKHA domain-containing protein [Spirochaetaceae bacterium]|jgi:uncharacterized 2Fe-2S/4Fe-4S cluster protein (DUF4445 family)|nr:ASKHA domain-containing protein [Spirochaetaceae bacterium]